MIYCFIDVINEMYTFDMPNWHFKLLTRLYEMCMRCICKSEFYKFELCENLTQFKIELFVRFEN